MLVLASLISWFGAELFKGIIFTIGLAILIPFLLLVLIYVVASLDEHPLFRKLLSKKAAVDKSPSLDLGKGKIASEEQVQPAEQVK